MRAARYVIALASMHVLTCAPFARAQEPSPDGTQSTATPISTPAPTTPPAPTTAPAPAPVSTPTPAPAAQSTAATTESVVAEPGTSLFEQTPAASHAEQPAQEASDGALALGGYVRSDLFVGKARGRNRAAMQAGYSELALKLEGSKQSLGSGYAEARFRYGEQLEQRELLVDLREAYVELHPGPFDLRLGQQIIVWGRADAFNPTNNLMPLDLRVRSPIEDDRRRSNLAARAHYNLEPLRIEGVWVPLYLPTEYPPLDAEPYIVFVEPDYPSLTLQDGSAGARVHLELPAFEASASYVNGFAPLPGIAWQSYTVGTEPPEGADPPEVRVARSAYRQHVVGVDFSTAISDLLALRGEAAYRHPLEHETRLHAARPDVQYVLGVDRSFGPVSVIAQYMGRYVLGWERERPVQDPYPIVALTTFSLPLSRLTREAIETQLDAEVATRNQVLFSQTERVQHLVSLRVEWLTLHETLSLSLLSMLNASTEEWLIFPKLDYRVSDALRAAVGAELYSGPAQTLFDLIDERLTAGYAELRYSF